MNDSCVSLGDIFAAASTRSASLVPETAGYLTLAIADASARMPLRLDARDILLTVDGDVKLASRGEVVSATDGARLLRERLGSLLSVSIGSVSGLASAARPRTEGARGVDDVAVEIESALIPLNRSAARRALARLARETRRAMESGALSAVNVPREPEAAPPPPSPPPAPRYVAPPPPRVDPLSTSTIAPAPHDAGPTSRPPSPGERRLEALRDRRTRSRGWVVPSLPPGASLSAVITAPLRLPKLPTPARIVAPEEAAAPRAFVRPLAVIPRPVLRASGALNELRIGPGGVGEIWAPSNPVEVRGRITEPAAAIDAVEHESESDDPPVMSFPESVVPPSARLAEPTCDASPSLGLFALDEPSALSFEEIHEPPSWGLSDGERVSPLALSVEPPPCDESASMKTTAIHGDAAFVIPFLDSALLEDDESLPLVELDVAPPMEAPQGTATPTIAMMTGPELEEPSEPTIATETSNILRITRPWPSVWCYEPSAQPNAAVSVTLAALAAPTAAATTLTNIPAPVALTNLMSDVEPGAPEGDAGAEEALDAAPDVATEQTAMVVEDIERVEEDIERVEEDIERVEEDIERAPGPTRADELLLRFATGGEGDGTMRSAVKGLRAMAGIDLTPTMAPMSVAPIVPPLRFQTPEPPGIDAFEEEREDETPPATSPPPLSSPVRRPPRGRLLVSAAAFAGGLAAATALVHVRPDFPDGVVALVARALPSLKP